jgi:hypothetical protein
VVVGQRPGVDYGNYGDPVAYRAEVRSIGKDLQHARALLQYVEWHDSITADDILDAAKHSFSGRLTITEGAQGSFTLDYCTGQYWPTEYRRAVCAVLAEAIWAWLRENAPVDAGPIEWHSNLQNVGGYIRKSARRELGRSIAARWFN